MTDIGVRAVRQEMRRGADRIGAATPPGRDRAVDALRAAAVLGVVLGHWLVTALVSDGRTLRTASPLHHMPWLTPISLRRMRIRRPTWRSTGWGPSPLPTSAAPSGAPSISRSNLLFIAPDQVTREPRRPPMERPPRLYLPRGTSIS